MPFLFFLVNINHIRMHMFIQNYHWDAYAFKTEKVKIVIFERAALKRAMIGGLAQGDNNPRSRKLSESFWKIFMKINTYVRMIQSSFNSAIANLSSSISSLTCWKKVIGLIGVFEVLTLDGE